VDGVKDVTGTAVGSAVDAFPTLTPAAATEDADEGAASALADETADKVLAVVDPA